MSETEPPSLENQTSTVPSPPRWVWALPFFLLVVNLLVSPNFQWIPIEHDSGSDSSSFEAPYGSDFLQDWIGGRIVLSRQRAQLYNLDFVQAAEHDTTVTGIEWAADRYFPMVYPPFHYLIVSPLSQLPYRWAVIVWAVFSTSSLTLAAWLLHRFYPPLNHRFGLWLVAIVLFVPWLKCLSMGQKSTFFLLLFTGTFLLLQRRQNFVAGLIFGLLAVKPQLGLVIGIAMLMKRQWSFVLGSLATVGTLVGVTYLIEPIWWRDYFSVVRGMGDYLDTGGYQIFDAHTLWGGLKLVLPTVDASVIKSLAISMSIAVIGIVMWAVQGGLKPNTQPFAFQYSMLMFATVLISPHFYSYDLTILLLPLLLIVAAIGFQPSTKTTGWLLAAAVLFYALSGSFPEIAKTIRFQFSLVLIVGMLSLLAAQCRQASGGDQISDPTAQ